VLAQANGLEAPRFVDGNDMLVAGLQESYTFETRANIPNQWERFAPHIGNVPRQVGKCSYGVCLKFDPECGFEYLSGVEVESTEGLPEEFSHVRIPAQRYAVFLHTEHVSSIAQTIDAIWSKWQPSSDLKVAQSPSFERYTEEFHPETGMGGIEIWIPLQQYA